MSAGRQGVQAMYLEKVVAPDKSNSPLGIVAISPDPQNTPTLADSSPTTLVILMPQLSRPQLQQTV